jgi:hypothetical protein
VPRLTARAAARPGPRRRPAHSGQRIPTGLEIMHLVQIGRPQFEHWTRVSSSGWR